MQSPHPGRAPVEGVTTEALIDDDSREVLEFLSRRPIHTVCMASYIREHGVESPFNRGRFYGCRDHTGKLVGVALIGHASLIETQHDDALKAFAQLQSRLQDTYLVRGEQEMIARFWDHYRSFGAGPRRTCRELLFEQRRATELQGVAPDLRQATEDDLTSITTINAQMLLTESGVDPLQKDPVGFRERIARRIRQGRVWVWARPGRLIFKADVFAETPEMIYLEGINVHPLERGKGHGLRCVSRLGAILLERSRAICLLVNEQREDLARFYRRAGYELRGTYETIYLDTKAN